MHDANAGAHEQGADQHRTQAELLAAGDIQRKAGHGDRGEQRGDCLADGVTHRDRHAEGLHADHVHRPDAATHGQRPEYQPAPLFGCGFEDAMNDRDGDIGGEPRDDV